MKSQISSRSRRVVRYLVSWYRWGVAYYVGKMRAQRDLEWLRWAIEVTGERRVYDLVRQRSLGAKKKKKKR